MPKQYRYREADALKLSKHGVDLTIYKNNADEVNDIVRVSVSEGHFEEFKDRISTYIYYIISGRGTFYLDGEPAEAEAGDVMIIPPNTQIYYFGTMEMMLVVTPRWNGANEEHIRFVDKSESPYA